MKSHLRFSKASKSTRRKIERIVLRGERFTRRRFVAADRPRLAQFAEGGRHEN